MSKIQVNEVVNHFDNGAPDFPRGVTVTGVSTFSGAVSVGGTLTYEDVTSIDSVGIITAQSGIKVLAGGATITGIVTATSFTGDGSALTGIAGTANVSTNTLNVIGVSTLSSGVFLPEDQELKLGGSAADPDFKIYNGSTSSYINSTQAGAYLRIISAGGMVMQVGGNENSLFAAQNGKVSLYYDGSEKIETTSTGVEVTGNITVNGENYPTSGSLSNRNKVINGSMQVAQRGTSTSSVTSSGYHAADRFAADLNAVGTWTFSQSTTSPDEFANSFKLFCTGAKASPDAGTVLIVNQRVEGFNLQSLKKGTSAAESVTLSFWVRSSKTGTYIAELRDNDNSRAISKTYSISSANTWEHKTLTFPGDTTGAFDNDNGLSLYINWWLAAGSNFTSGTLSTSWASITNANRAVGVVNLADNEDNDWYITGVQLEVGEKATPFEHRSFGDELARCQRYYQRITAQTVNARLAIGGNGSVAQCFPTAYLPTTMRAQPSVSYSAASDFTNEGIAGGGTQTVTSISFNAASSHAVTIQSQASGGNTSGTGAQVLSNNTNAHLAFHAEL